MTKLQTVCMCICLGAWLAPSAGCGDEKADAASTLDDQTPPTGATAIRAWLARGAYKRWQCEADVHEARSPSPHGFNRICSNTAISARVGDSDAWPKGAAAVKELYTGASETVPVGYAVYLKTADDSAGGSNWYWYEEVPGDSAVPHDDDGVVADGLGGSGTPKSICVGCHVAAGSDAAHTPSEGGRDQVYTPVP